MNESSTGKSPEPDTIESTQPTRLQIAARPALMMGLMLLSDTIAIVLAGVITVLGRKWLGGDFVPILYLRLSPVVLVILVAFAVANLYRSIPVKVPHEFQRVFRLVSLVYLGLGTATFFVRGAQWYSRAIFIVAWALTIAFVLLGRWLLRLCFSHKPWWGHPTIVMGDKQARQIIKELLRNPRLGLTPIAHLTDRQPARSYGADRAERVPCIHETELGEQLSRRRCVLLVIHNVPNEALAELLVRNERSFSRVIALPDPARPGSVPVAAWRFAGIHGTQVRRGLPGWLHATIKRCLDVLLIILALPVLAVALPVVALLVKLDSPGPVFYGHSRVGRKGRSFRLWKFRTMVSNADEVLEDYLEEHPELRSQWERQRKLKNDPRITPLGQFLRRTSLDELPQLWNVLVGQMSLVGPRPIVENEVPRYGEGFSLYKRVRPGISGCWQVSGRNDTSYHERIQIDMYYARNWSIWLDLWVLATTIPTVLRRRGAY